MTSSHSHKNADPESTYLCAFRSQGGRVGIAYGVYGYAAFIDYEEPTMH